MNTPEIIRLAVLALQVAESAGASATELAAKVAQARAEGRELTGAELDELSDSAQAAIDRI